MQPSEPPKQESPSPSLDSAGDLLKSSPPLDSSNKTLLEVLDSPAQKLLLTQRESDLADLLIELVKHVRVRDASGNFTRVFCAGCEHRRLEPCPFEKISIIADDLDKRRQKSIVIRYTGTTLTTRNRYYPSIAPDA